MTTSDMAEKGSEKQVSAGQLDKVEFTNEYIYDQAMLITKAGQEKGLILRLIGATAFLSHCPKNGHHYQEMNRKFTDVDLVTYSKTPIDKLDEMFKSIGYEPIRALGWHSTTRDIYVNEEKLYVDVFRDVLSYCHPISFIDRLELDFPTIPLVDLLLEKVQIVEINQKDLFDIVMVLLEHELGSGENKEEIDVDRILDLWTKDWGFYYTGTTNLRKAQDYIEKMPKLTAAEGDNVRGKIDALIERVETAPKSLAWKLRSKIGTRVRWYEEVEEVER